MTAADRNPLAAASDDFSRAILQQLDFGDVLEVHQILSVATHQHRSLLQYLECEFGDSALMGCDHLHTCFIGVDVFDVVESEQQDTVAADARNLAQTVRRPREGP